MTATVKRIYEESMMQLNPGERIDLAEMLMGSTEDFVNTDVELAWNEEIKRRIEDYQSGNVKPIPAEEVYAEIRRSLKEAREGRRISAGSKG